MWGSRQPQTQRKGLWVSAPQGLPTRWWSPSQRCSHVPEMRQDLSPQLQSSAGIWGPASKVVPAAPSAAILRAKQASRVIYGVSKELPRLFRPRHGSEVGDLRHGSTSPDTDPLPWPGRTPCAVPAARCGQPRPCRVPAEGTHTPPLRHARQNHGDYLLFSDSRF